jgi:hypothetical protein
LPERGLNLWRVVATSEAIEQLKRAIHVGKCTDSRLHPASDVSRARRFYEATVGLNPKEEYAGGVIYECGGTEVFLYLTSNAGASKASQAFWQVDDVESEVAELKARGVKFEEYGMPGVTMKKQYCDRRRSEDRLV